MRPADFAIVGGGIVGCAAAAFLAEAGASVLLVEKEAVGAAASGRNSGAVQHPFDPELTGLHYETVEIYRALAGFPIPREPAGLLVLSHEEREAAALVRSLAEAVPELEARLVTGEELRALEPQLAEGLSACRLETAYAIPPASATAAFAERARRAGTRIQLDMAVPWIEADRVRGLEMPSRKVVAGAVLVAAGPWSSGLIGRGGSAGLGGAPGSTGNVITPIWGVNVHVELDHPPRHVVEQLGVETADPAGVADVAGEGEAPSLFSLVTAGGESTLGSTFLDSEPDGEALAPLLRERGSAFIPALRDARIVATRTCARPQSPDGRPLLGPVPGVEGLFVCAGHGPWGISIGPASARLVADALLGRAPEIPPALSAARLL